MDVVHQFFDLRLRVKFWELRFHFGFLNPLERIFRQVLVFDAPVEKRRQILAVVQHGTAAPIFFFAATVEELPQHPFVDFAAGGQLEIAEQGSQTVLVTLNGAG